jgi:PAS domain S-box-containing protein
MAFCEQLCELRRSALPNSGRRASMLASEDTRLVEQVVRADRELLETIINSIPVMITIYEPGTRLVRVNREFERLIGWSREEAAGISIMEECYPDPDDRRRAVEFMESCRQGWMDFRMRTRDGREIETSWANVRLSDERQVGIGIDITERKAQELALREVDRRKDEFVATLAHELRNPMAPIRSALEVLRLAADGAASRQARAVLDRQVGQMTQLIDDLLDLSRIRHGKITVRKERVTLQAVVANVLETTRPNIEAGRHELTVRIPDREVWVDADPIRLAQAIVNLVNNACAHSPPGSAIELCGREHGDSAVVEVCDEGRGIPPGRLARIFDMFAQADEEGDSHRGLGVGLALTRAIVELHAGDIEVTSQVGAGSRFVIRLPRAPAPADAGVRRGEGAAPVAASRGRLRVLVVDDNRDAAESLALWIETLGHEVVVAYDGSEALEKALRASPDLVLLDIGLPGVSGNEVARRLRASAQLRDAMLVALSGWGSAEDRASSMRAGFDQHLAKPIELDTLQHVLTAALARRKV